MGAKFLGNENGIVRVKPYDSRFTDFYEALVNVAKLSDLPMQILYELWLDAVLNGLEISEIESELLDLAIEVKND